MFQYVLIVDDDEAVQDIMREYFIDYGLSKGHVFTASNPMEALEIFNLNKELISLVICDLYMPIANGTEICEIMKQSNPDLPIIIHTGDLNVTIDPFDYIDYILYKPCSVTEVLKMIKKIESNKVPVRKWRDKREIVGQYQIGHVTDKLEKTYMGTVFSQSKGGCAICFQTPLNIKKDETIELSLGSFQAGGTHYVVLFKSKARVVWVKLSDSDNVKMGLQFL
jgi:CheY-like chemotaxis protein